ncbi:hypothetical protein DTO013E5_9782 [Penicillium roqueforti]|nr:hypothetical protein DTO012A1_9825 [Penicillium roqueforti]KAI2739887.1 hypothetical protein DTO013F2_9250 [Penicillium roqueforti]KAI2766292.1 hypothetical protein DTO012A8_8493 [Penicillium roqueforti]KAI3143507.1 hypothetical protein CBS147325_5424 [Penicillium roqueforti]KAI3169714.1 hypothetical protein DTO046C5_3507 [Penicillium roqueforti]
MVVNQADIYSHGRSEEIIANFLKQTKIPRERIVILTKCYFGVDDQGRQPQNSATTGNDGMEWYGDVFIFVLLGKHTTVCLGAKGNNFVLNGKYSDLSAEEVYSLLTTPVFGSGVVFDCPNGKLMQQKKFVKFGLTDTSLKHYVRLIALEAEKFFASYSGLQGTNGVLDVPPAMAEPTIYTASRSPQGKEVRAQFDSTIAELFHDLDYKDGGTEIAQKMIALLLGGHHSSSATISYIILQLASHPEVQEELLKEQLDVLGSTDDPLTYEELQKLKVHQYTVKETLRLHNPVHSILRQVKSPLVIHGNISRYIIPPSHLVIASPASSSRDEEYFSEPMKWAPYRWKNKVTANMIVIGDEDEKKSTSSGSNSPYLPFGGGRHRCIGERFAYVQLGVMLALLVRHFKFLAFFPTDDPRTCVVGKETRAVHENLG